MDTKALNDLTFTDDDRETIEMFLRFQQESLIKAGVMDDPTRDIKRLGQSGRPVPSAGPAYVGRVFTALFASIGIDRGAEIQEAKAAAAKAKAEAATA